ncbi:ArnT family glycosyltransferase [Spirillospora sp. CA-128828]|uniref:ArnT family glycosyltransferase n=1 Tax=Spirillospora sp. CA-128828 TaxID=3240033 RepID=UPI003D8F2D4D
MTHSADIITSSRPRTRPSAIVRRPGWAPAAALAAILVAAATLYGWALGSLGWGNAYYSAAVKSMGENFTNFLFGSYDPVGVVTVDKPPAGLWPQVISSKVFGLHGWALLLPQVAEGVLAVLMLHRTVRRWAGESAGLIAALVLTLTPITVAVTRTNNLDTPLLLLLVCAAYALTRALQELAGRAATWWLCGAAFLIGCGFVTKMLAAWMVLPAFAAAWLVGAAGPWRAAVRRMLVAGGVLAVASLWWVALVAVWPGDRPYVGGSEDGSAWDLLVGYNGLGRVFGQGEGPGTGPAFGGMSGGTGMLGRGAMFGGDAGVLRMFGEQVGGQISWLLPVCAAAIGVAVAGAVLRRRNRLPAEGTLPATGWVLWSVWLLVCAAVFSLQEGIFHPYYTTQLAPAIGALCGGLVAALRRAHRAGARWPVPVGASAIAVTVGWALIVIRRAPEWHGWLVWPVLAAGAAAVVLSCAAFRWSGRLLPAALGAGVLAVLMAPGAWAVIVPGGASSPMGGAIPAAGPATMPFGGGRGMPRGMPLPPQAAGDEQGMPQPGETPSPAGIFGSGGGALPQMAGMAGMGGSRLTADQRRILDYARRNSGSARITLAVEGGAMAASGFILNSDSHVIGMGGFSATDDVPSTRQLEQWTRNGGLRFVLSSPMASIGTAFGGAGKDDPATRRTAWVAGHCRTVPPSAYGVSAAPSGRRQSGPVGFGGTNTLYDCAAG